MNEDKFENLSQETPQNNEGFFEDEIDTYSEETDLYVTYGNRIAHNSTYGGRNYRNYGYGSYGHGYGGGYSRRRNYHSSYLNSYSYISGDKIIEDKELYYEIPEGYTLPEEKLLRTYTEANYNYSVRSKERMAVLKEIILLLRSYVTGIPLVRNADIDENPDKNEVYKEVLDYIKSSEIPGYSYYEKASYILYKMLSEEAKEEKQEGKFIDTLRTERLFDYKLDYIYADPVYKELKDIENLKKSIDISSINSILKKISLISDFGKEFHVEIEIDENKSETSYLKKHMLMQTYDQIKYIDTYQKLLPDYKMKLTTKNLVVNQPINRKETKQKIIMLVDFSGSMCSTFKQEWVVAILLNRLKTVIDGNSEIFFSFFVENYLGFTHIYDKKSAIKFLNGFSTHPNGGDTRVGKIVNNIERCIKNGKNIFNCSDKAFKEMQKHNPEILIINDGQDSIKQKFKYKTNAITLDSENNQLKKAVFDTKGRYIHIDYDGEILKYNNVNDYIKLNH